MLSATDIQNKEFKKATFGGYNIEEVNDFMDQILKDYQELLSENFTLKDKVNALNESVQYYRTMESTIQNVLVLADKTAQETKIAAQKKADDTTGVAYEKAEQIKQEAQVRAEHMIALAEERVTNIINQGRQEAYLLEQKVDETKRQYNAYKTQFKQLVQAQLEFLEQGDRRIRGLQDDLTEAFDKIQVEQPIEDKKYEKTIKVTEKVKKTEKKDKTEKIETGHKTKEAKKIEIPINPTLAPLSQEEMNGLLN